MRYDTLRRLFCLALAASVSCGNLWVLCHGEDGTVAVEPRHPSGVGACQAGASPCILPGGAMEDHCHRHGECLDLPVLRIATLGRNLADGLADCVSAPAAAVWQAPDVGPLPASDFQQRPMRPPGRGRCFDLRTVVLLI